MTLRDMLLEITPLPWRTLEADNDKVIPTVRILGRRRSDHEKEICIGRIDVMRDAGYACHAATVLPDTVHALRLLLEDKKRQRSGLTRPQVEFCEQVLARAEGERK
jgi:hypothetical protein